MKKAVNFIGSFEHHLSEEARRRGASGVICGHIHHAANREIGDIHYLNCGDWVESCTAIGETHAGEFELVRWRDLVASQAAESANQPSLEVAA